MILPHHFLWIIIAELQCHTIVHNCTDV
uniref:Uncharacterized protein n=1 Tax=Arundo donax TaxID=35708 RepID=A0A0A9C249_ARUDO